MICDFDKSSSVEETEKKAKISFDLAIKNASKNSPETKAAATSGLNDPQTPSLPTHQETASAYQGIRELVQGLIEHSSYVQKNLSRHSFAPQFKDLIQRVHKNFALSWNDLSELTDVPAATLRGFRENALLTRGEGLSEEHIKIRDYWNSAPQSERQSLDCFISWLMRENPHESFIYYRVREVLIELGLYAPRGPKVQKGVAQKKKSLGPHALWEGDGKLMRIVLNGVLYRFICFGFVDQDSSLIVSLQVSDTEDIESLRTAFDNGVLAESITPFGILIDNRFSSSEEHHALREFAREKGIEIVRTFPGNSKSNGNIECLWSLYESQIGEIQISGENQREIASSLLQSLCKVFAMVNNNRPRPGKPSRRDKADSSKQNPDSRQTVNQLAARFDPKPSAELPFRVQLIDQLIGQHFSAVKPKLLEPFRKNAVKHTLSELSLAKASFDAQVAKHPEQDYGPEYFLAILRHARESNAKAAFNESLRLSSELCREASDLNESSTSELPQGIVDAIVDSEKAKSPAETLAYFDAIAFCLAKRSLDIDVALLWTRITQLAERSRKLSSQTWQSAVRHIYERIGRLLYSDNKLASSSA